MDSKIIESYRCWKDLILYRLNLILNSNQDLALLRQNRSLGLLDIKNYKNKTLKSFHTVA